MTPSCPDPKIKKEDVGKPYSLLGRIMANMEASSKECQHHWVIDAPDGPVSRGVCKLCQLVREFKNTVGGDKWGYFRLSKNNDGQRVE